MFGVPRRPGESGSPGLSPSLKLVPWGQSLCTLKQVRDAWWLSQMSLRLLVSAQGLVSWVGEWSPDAGLGAQRESAWVFSPRPFPCVHSLSLK